MHHHVRQPQYETHKSSAHSQSPGIHHGHQLMVEYSQDEGSQYLSMPPHDSLSHLAPIAEQPTSSPWFRGGDSIPVFNASPCDTSISQPIQFQQAPPSSHPEISRGRISISALCEGLGGKDRLEKCVSNSQVCYGAICDINAEIRQGPPSHLHCYEDTHTFDILSGSECFVICSYSTNEMLGFINMDTSLILKALQAIGEIRLVTSLTTSEWIAMVTGKSKHSLDTLEISIFGEFALSNDVGDLLSRAGLFLQAPAFNSNIPYHNPQMISFGDISDKDSECESTESHKCSGQIESKSTRPSAAALLNVLDHLQQHEYLHPVGPQSALTVELLHHQKEGIDFMTRREMGESTSSLSFWDMEANLNGRLYRHAITGLKTRDPLPGPFGGILADEMGLGKTLTTLATIISTLEHAEATLTTSSSNACSVAPKQRSKATLIVIPSEALMDQWIEEISKRVKPGILTTCRYHGQARKSQSLSLERMDVVLTTYGTIKSEFSRGNGLLHRTEFFRVVLDEAHDIRTRSTQKFTAVNAVSANRRWCITGTPIQNELADLGTLVSFLRVPYLSEPEVFRTHIINPAYFDNSARFDNLRLLLGCICLRRTKDMGHLAEPKFEMKQLDLSPTEAQAYNQIVEYHRTAMDRSVSTCNSAATNRNIFQALLKLRVLCNNGVYKVFSPTKDAQFDADEYFFSLQLRNKARCTVCNRGVWFLANSLLPEAGIFAKCQHLICGCCVNLSMQHNSFRPSGLQECLSCLSQPEPGPQMISCVQEEGLDPDTPSSNERCPSPLPGATYPTKLIVLLESIKAHIDEKCIVFSGWKKSLDIVAILLKQDGIEHARIDGSVPNPERLRVLGNFNCNQGMKVLLMTIGTGAVGLNLTSATRVHILEPQWNPMVERQAIGRVVRLGQTKDVVITRYIMKGTVEESVLSSQDYKIQAAMKGFESRNSFQDSDQRFHTLKGKIQPVHQS